MDFRIVDDLTAWDDFLSHQPLSQFLQSWQWGEFQKAVGRRVLRVGFFEDGRQIGAAQIVEHYLGVGFGYLYCPRGPIFLKFSISNFQFPMKEFISFIKKSASSYGELFLRMEPLQQLPITNYQLPIIRVPGNRQPTHILLLDLRKIEEQILSEMHPKTRYNIRLAEKKGLRAYHPERSEGSAHFPAFWSLITETSKRDRIKPHPRKYYHLILDKVVSCQLLVVSYHSTPLATGLFIGFGDTFTYVHGGSSNKHREMMAPYLLQWEAIKFAKKAGYHYYDFGGLNPAHPGGVNPDDASDFDFRPGWAGITRFKRGFGGSVKSYAGTYDAVMNERGYRMYSLVRKIRQYI